MAPPDQGSGASPPAAAALRRQMSCTCSRDEPVQLERRLSCSSASFSSPTASPAPSSSASTTYHPAASSNNPSCESIPFADPELLLLGSASSYESFFHYDDPGHDDGSMYLDFEPSPATRAPAVQAMTAAQLMTKAATQCRAAYDPKKLPSAMFRTRSTNPAEWSVASNESLFSIRLGSSGDIGDLYYDAAGFPRFPSMGSDTSSMMRTPSVSEGTAGGLCLREDCARCSGSGATRKSVRFATTESVSGGSKHSAVSPAHADVQEPVACTAMTPVTAAGWCQLGCWWPSLPTMWWPRCCAWQCHCCNHR